MGGALDQSVATVRRAVREACADLGPGSTLLVASSGGADSLVLAAAAVFEGRKAGWLVGAATIDHGLQDGSAAIAERAAGALTSLGCEPVRRVAVTVSNDGGPEGAARAARYDALEAIAAESGAAVVLLGHTLDDQAETVLLGLARGSGLRSLAGMAPVRGPFRRPLLGVHRATVRAAAHALGLDPWDDPHNADSRFARVRVRDRVLPMLDAELGPGVADALSRTADLARDGADALDIWAAAVLADAEKEPGTLVLDVVGSAPRAVRTRVLRLAAIAAGSPPGDLAATHVRALDALVTSWHGQRGVDLPGKVVARRSGGELRFS